MDQQEQIVINLIVNAGSARSSAIEAIQYAKAGDIEKAEESLEAVRDGISRVTGYRVAIQQQLEGVESAKETLASDMSSIDIPKMFD